jgi:ATP-dependent Lhr-like helicase
MVILLDGRPGAYLERGGRRLLTFTTDAGDLRRVAEAVAALARRRRFQPATVNGAPVERTPLGDALVAAGFVPTYRGLALRRP